MRFDTDISLTFSQKPSNTPKLIGQQSRQQLIQSYNVFLCYPNIRNNAVKQVNLFNYNHVRLKQNAISIPQTYFLKMWRKVLACYKVFCIIGYKLTKRRG